MIPFRDTRCRCRPGRSQEVQSCLSPRSRFPRRMHICLKMICTDPASGQGRNNNRSFARIYRVGETLSENDHLRLVLLPDVPREAGLASSGGFSSCTSAATISWNLDARNESPKMFSRDLVSRVPMNGVMYFLWTMNWIALAALMAFAALLTTSSDY